MFDKILTPDITKLLLIPLFEFEPVFKESDIMEKIEKISDRSQSDKDVLTHLAALCTTFVYDNIDKPTDLSKCYRFSPALLEMHNKKTLTSVGSKWLEGIGKFTFEIEISSENQENAIDCLTFKVVTRDNDVDVTEQLHIELSTDKIKFYINNPRSLTVDYSIDVLDQLINLDTIFKSKLQYILGGLLSYKENMM